MRYLILVALLIAGPAFAGSNSNNSDSSTVNVTANGGNATGGNAIAGGGNSSVGNVTANGGTHTQTTINAVAPKQEQQQTAIAGSAAKQSQSANNAGNKQQTAITIEDAKQAPGVALGAASPSANCQQTGGAGGSWLGGSIVLNGSKTESECDKREWARTLAGLGAGLQALRVACMSETVRKANPLDCAAIKQDDIEQPKDERPMANRYGGRS